MRKKTGLLQHQFAHGREVFERAIEAQLFQKLFGFRKHSLRLVAQAEQSLFASRSSAGFGHRKNFVWRHVGLHTGFRVSPERAIAAIIAAKMGERDEDLLGIAD